MERISIEKTLEILNLFIRVLVSKPRLEKTAELIVYNHKIKFDYFMKNLFLSFNSHCGLDSLEGRFAIPRNFLQYSPEYYNHFDFNDSEEAKDNTPISLNMTLEIIKMFSSYFKDCFCSESRAGAILKDENSLIKMVDDLFDLNPATNLFEYLVYTSTLPQSSFKEVEGGYGILADSGTTLVCIDKKICGYYGYKFGDKFGRYSFVGIAPSFSTNHEEKLSVWLVKESGHTKGKSIRLEIKDSLKESLRQLEYRF